MTIVNRWARAGTCVAVAAALLVAAPKAAAERIVLTANSGSLNGIESLTAFTVKADGGLVPGAPLPVGARPEGVAITPDGRRAYVATSQSPGVRGYAIGAGGTLTPVPGSPSASGGINTTGVAVTPAGDRLLVTNRGTAQNNAVDQGSVAVYDIAPGTGTLTAVAGSPFAITGLENPQGIAIAPDGARAFVAGDTAGATFSPRVAVLSIAPGTGALAQVAGSPFASGGTQAFSIVISPAGDRVFVGNVSLLASSISVLDVAAATGALTPAAGSPFATAGRAPIALALSADATRLYGAERGPAAAPAAHGVSAYDISAQGAPASLTPVAGSPFSTGGAQLQGVASTPDGRQVYGFLNADPGGVAGFSTAPGAGLAPIAGSPYPTGDRFAGFLSIAMTPSQTPVPAVTATVAPPGGATAFDASATTVPGGVVTRYDWDFGDGSTLPDGGPTPTHVYAAPGAFTARVTVGNDCARIPGFTGGALFTGQTAHCNGAPTASAALPLTITTPGSTTGGGAPTAGTLRPLTLKITGARTVKRGGRVTFVYRVRNTTAGPVAGVVIRSTLPKGVSIDGASRRANLRVTTKALRFTGRGRALTFSVGRILPGRTVVVRVDARVAARAGTGARIGTVVLRAKGVGPVRATRTVIVR